MTDSDLENLYKQNVAESHYAGLRGVFDAGYALGAASGTPTTDQSLTVAAPAAAAVDPTITTA